MFARKIRAKSLQQGFFPRTKARMCAVMGALAHLQCKEKGDEQDGHHVHPSARRTAAAQNLGFVAGKRTNCRGKTRIGSRSSCESDGANTCRGILTAEEPFDGNEADAFWGPNGVRTRGKEAGAPRHGVMASVCSTEIRSGRLILQHACTPREGHVLPVDSDTAGKCVQAQGARRARAASAACCVPCVGVLERKSVGRQDT